MVTTVDSEKQMDEQSFGYHDMNALQPSFLLRHLYESKESPWKFLANNYKEACAWQVQVREKLSAVLGIDKLIPVNPDLTCIEETNRGNFTRKKYLMRTSEYCIMPFFLLIPKNKLGPLPLIVALHGHGIGAKDIVGLWEDGGERLKPEGYQQDFAVALCQEGFVVAAPEIACFGERQSNFSHLRGCMGRKIPSSCYHTAVNALHLGITTAGLRVFDTIRLIDALENHTIIDRNRIGIMGISGGGMVAFLTACIDLRVRAAVISGYFCKFRDSFLAMKHCLCNIIPGLHLFGDIHDLAGLIAPRPLCIETGANDPIFPSISAIQATEKTQEIYRVFNTNSIVEIDIFDGGHRINGKKAYPFLIHSLG